MFRSSQNIKAMYMRALILLAVIAFFVGSEAFATDGNFGIDIGTGYQSNHGLLGAEGRYFLNPNQDFHLTTGFDVSGFLVGVGSRLYTSATDDNCIFIFDCKSRYFIGGTILRSNGATATVEDEGHKGEYTQSYGLAGNIALGSYDQFAEGFTLGLEIGFRAWIQRPAIDFKSGTFLQKHQDELERSLNDSVSFSLTLGWLF